LDFRLLPSADARFKLLEERFALRLRGRSRDQVSEEYVAGEAGFSFDFEAGDVWMEDFGAGSETGAEVTGALVGRHGFVDHRPLSATDGLLCGGFFDGAAFFFFALGREEEVLADLRLFARPSGLGGLALERLTFPRLSLSLGALSGGALLALARQFCLGLRLVGLKEPFGDAEVLGFLRTIPPPLVATLLLPRPRLGPEHRTLPVRRAPSAELVSEQARATRSATGPERSEDRRESSELESFVEWSHGSRGALRLE
jgi:hypothetical protein